MATEVESTRESRAEKAYAVFLSLGEKRSYRQVAERFGVALATAKRWAAAGQWQSRVREQEARAARELADRYQSGQMAQTERNLKIVRAALLALAKDVAERKIRGQYSDIPRLVQLENDLLGKTSSSGAPATQSRVVIYIPDNGRTLYPNAQTKDQPREERSDGDGLPQDDAAS